MKPALSVIFFTVSSGAGLGLMFLLVLSRFSHLAPASPQWWAGAIASAILLTAGLVSSTLHLANPKNAWRAFSRFRTSWLSREGVLAVAIYPLFAIYLWAVLQQHRGLIVGVGFVLALLCLAVLYSTAMIYACLKTIPRWNNWQTRLAFPVFGLMSGSVLLLAFVPQARPFAGPMAIGMLVLGGLLKMSYVMRFTKMDGQHMSINQALQPVRKQQAGQVRLLDVGHSAGTFLTNEFMFELARGKALQLRWAMWILGFIVPVLLLLISTSPVLVWLAALLSLAGLLCERWLFFAEAQHVVRLYHGQASI
jgi:sulfite dehydrogenase (quinone) subunit SoeC